MKGRWKNCYPCMYGHIDAFFTLLRRVYIFCTHLHFESQLRLSRTQVFDIKRVKRNPQFDSPLTFLQVQSKRAISFSSNFASAERCLIYENDWNSKLLKKICINSGAFFPMQAFFQMLKISVPHKWWRAKFSLVPENIGKWNKKSLCVFFVIYIQSPF